MTVKGSKAVLPMLPPPPPVVQTHKKKLSGPNLQQVFNAAKNTLATHPKLCVQLIKVYQKAEFESFFTEFLDLLKVCLVVGEKQPQVERVLSFVARFTTADKAVKKEGKDKKDEGQDKEKVRHEKEQESFTSKDDVSSSASNDATVETEEEEVEEEVDPFLINMFQFLLSSHEANSNAVRYRVCQLINRILNSMGESASLDDDLFSTIYDTMLQRLMDKKPAVRVQAILALNRLQDPRNKDCPVIKAYRYHLSMDPASDVRRAVLLSTAITFQTLPDVLHRTRDKNHLVRRQAYLVLAQKVHIRSLQISQRVRLLSEGLNDRSDIVRLAVQKNLLQAWLRFVNGSVLDLLTCLDVEASTKGAELALDTLFIDVPASTLVQNFNLLAENRLLPYENLRPESVLYWKCLAKHLKKECAEEELDHILPDLSVFCEYVRTYVSSDDEEGMEDDAQAVAVRQMEREFVLQQLVQLTSCYDLSDEVGRQCLDKLVRTLLVCERVGEASINVLVDVFARLHPPHTRVHQLAEIISDVREPISTPAEDISMVTVAAATPAATPAAAAKATGARNEHLSEEEQRANKIKAAKVRVQLNQAREELEECVRSLDLDRAQDLKLQLRALEQQHELLQQQLATPAQTPRAVAAASDAVDVTQSEEVLLTDTQKETAAAEEPQEKDDPQTLARCLTIVCQMLRSPEITTVTPTLYSLHDNLLLPCLKNQEPLVRKLAVQALSLLCLVSKELAQKHLLLFVQISQIDIEVIQVLALHAVFDFLLLYGVDEFTAVSQGAAGLAESCPQGDGLDNANTVINVLSKRLESEEPDVRTAVAMGLCKLLQAARVTSPSLLTHLTLLWYNPTTEDDNMLRHMLGVFFPLYAAHGGTNQESVSLSVLPTLRALVDAAPKSPLAQVDVDDVANFLVSITSPAVVTKKGVDCVNQHDSLVFAIFAEMLAHSDSALSRYLVKTLRYLHVSPTNYVNLRQILTLTEKLAKKFHERGMLAPLEKFQASIKEFLKNAPVKEEKEEEEEVSKLDDKDKTSVTFSDMTITNKTVDNTFARRKRQLYTTQMDGDILSSEAETDNEDLIADIKTDAEQDTRQKETDEDDALLNTVIIRGANDKCIERESNVTVVTGAQEQELQLPTPILDRSLSSDDLFASPVLSGPNKSVSIGDSARTPEKDVSSDGIATSGTASRKRGNAKGRSNRKSVAGSDLGDEVNTDNSSADDFFSATEDTESETQTPQKKMKRGSRQSKDTTPVTATRRRGRPCAATKTLSSAASGGSSSAASRSGSTRRTRNTSTQPSRSPLAFITSTDEEDAEVASTAKIASGTRSSRTRANNPVVEPLPVAHHKRLVASSTSPPSSSPNTAITTAASKVKKGRLTAAKEPVVERVDETITSSCSTPGGSPETSLLKDSIKIATDSPPSSFRSCKSGVDSSPLQQTRSTRSSKGESGSTGLRRNHRGKVVFAQGRRIAAASVSTESSTSSTSGSPVRPATKRLRGVTVAVSPPKSEGLSSPASTTSGGVKGARRSTRRGQGSITTTEESPATSSPATRLRRLKDTPTGSSPGNTASRSTRAGRVK